MAFGTHAGELVFAAEKLIRKTMLLTDG